MSILCKIFGHRESLLACAWPEYMGKCGRCGSIYNTSAHTIGLALESERLAWEKSMMEFKNELNTTTTIHPAAQ